MAKAKFRPNIALFPNTFQFPLFFKEEETIPVSLDFPTPNNDPLMVNLAPPQSVCE